MHTPLPTTIAEWLGRYVDGAAPEELLWAAWHRCEALPTGTWIQLAPPAHLQGQVDALAEASARHADRTELIRRYPLFGVPFAAKDNIDVAGLSTTAACKAHSRTADSDAHVIARLKAAGAVCMGKTNLDQFATGLVGTRSPYGRPSSVFSAQHVSGGSSSGSALCVAHGAVAFSLGTDTAGSGRIPAAFNQIVGLKPTPGRVSMAGVLPACRSLDCPSVFAHTVEDAAHVLHQIEGDDPQDPYSRPMAGPRRWPRERLRIGVPAPAALDCDSAYAPAWHNALVQLRELGHEPVPIDFEPLAEIAGLLYDGPWVAERYAVIEALIEGQPDALDPAVRDVVSRARALRAVDVFRGQYRLRSLARAAEAVWQRADVLVVPTAPSHPTTAEVDADPLGANAALGRYTNFVNLLGWCAISLPAGSTTERLPFGITFIADQAHDTALVEIGCAWQDHAGLPSGVTGEVAVNAGSASLLRPRAASTARIAVVGAHLSGMPLNAQLTERGAWLVGTARTAPHYRLHALPGTVPSKPGMVRTSGPGHAIDVEVWEMPLSNYGSFVAAIPYPLGVRQIELSDGQWVQGFVCDAVAAQGAPDISHFGGWRTYLASLDATAESIE